VWTVPEGAVCAVFSAAIEDARVPPGVPAPPLDAEAVLTFKYTVAVPDPTVFPHKENVLIPATEAVYVPFAVTVEVGVVEVEGVTCVLAVGCP
jgi:hypothetical protein